MYNDDLPNNACKVSLLPSIQAANVPFSRSRADPSAKPIRSEKQKRNT